MSKPFHKSNYFINFEATNTTTMTSNKLVNTAIEQLMVAQGVLTLSLKQGNLSMIDRDLALEKIRSAYELLIIAASENLHNAPEPTPTTKPNTANIVANPPEEQVKIVPDEKMLIGGGVNEVPNPPQGSAGEGLIEVEVGDVAIPVLADDLARKDAGIPKAEKPTERQITPPAPQVSAPTPSQTIPTPAEKGSGSNGSKLNPETLSSKFEGTKRFRNESFNVNLKDVSTKLQNKPIEDLTKSIGINDKFLYTKELFNGNAQLYAKTIRRLNEFTDINDALFFIEENFSWEQNNEAANQLIDLVRRKLLKS